MTSLKRNIVSVYTSQIYVTGVGIAMTPLYIRYMGPEAYGLIGFFSVLQALFNFLDMGLTPTTARETARYGGGAMDALNYRRLTRALEGVFFGVALVGGTLMFVSADRVASDWLSISALSYAETSASIQLMSAVVVLRWISGFYRGVIGGHERLFWLGVFNAGIATLRFVLVMPLLIFFDATPVAFFKFQLLVAFIEISTLAWFAYRLMPAVPFNKRISWEWAPLKSPLKFSLSIAFTASVWVLVTQTDKLVLSRILPLSDYGYFSVAVLVASGIAILSGPVSGAIMPRMARLHAENRHEDINAVYRHATQLVMVVVVPVSLVLAFYPEEVLWAWTGDATLVEKAAPVLRLYSVGYCVLAASAFPYYLQYANGNLSLHVIGNVLFIALLIPSVIFGTLRFGMEGAGWAWLAANSVYFIAWVPLVHKRFFPGQHLNWLVRDIFAIAVPATMMVSALASISSFENFKSRWAVAGALLLIGLIALVISIVCSSYFRSSVYYNLKNFK